MIWHAIVAAIADAHPLSKCDLIAGGDTGGDSGKGNGGDVRVEDEINHMSTSITCLVWFKIRFELCELVSVYQGSTWGQNVVTPTPTRK